MRHDEPIMALLRTEGRPMTCKEIAERLNVPRNSTRRTIGALQKFRMIRPGPEIRMEGQRLIITWEAEQ